MLKSCFFLFCNFDKITHPEPLSGISETSGEMDNIKQKTNKQNKNLKEENQNLKNIQVSDDNFVVFPKESSCMQTSKPATLLNILSLEHI